jgi:hypothetical protein
MLHKTLPRHSVKQLHKHASPLKCSNTSISDGSDSTGTSTGTGVGDEESFESTTLDDSTVSHDDGDNRESEKDDIEPEVDEEAALGEFFLSVVLLFLNLNLL